MVRPDPSATASDDERPRLRQQIWALHAYRSVESVPAGPKRNDYGVAVNDLGADVLRGGLAAAMAALERKRERGGELLLQHLAEAGITGLEGANGKNLPDQVRSLDLDTYLLATREILQLATWFRRALQATSPEEG
jgi:CRISPR-associated protein Cmr5